MSCNSDAGVSLVGRPDAIGGERNTRDGGHISAAVVLLLDSPLGEWSERL